MYNQVFATNTQGSYLHRQGDISGSPPFFPLYGTEHSPLWQIRHTAGIILIGTAGIEAWKLMDHKMRNFGTEWKGPKWENSGTISEELIL